jgi:hypothetical protein
VWHATLVRETVRGLRRTAALRQTACQRASLPTLRFRLPKDAFLLEGHCLASHGAVKETRSTEPGRTQESGAVWALPMQVLRKQWNQRAGRDKTRRANRLVAFVDRRMGRQIWEQFHNRRHGANDSFGTGDSAYLHVWVRPTSSWVVVMMTKRLQDSLGAWKGLGNSTDADGNRTVVVGVRPDDNSPPGQGTCRDSSRQKDLGATPSFRNRAGACPLCQPP